MLIKPDCLACMVTQAVEAARLAGADEATQWRLGQRAAELVARLPSDITPIVAAAEVQALVRSELGVEDPYAEIRRDLNSRALALLPALRDAIGSAPDPLEAAVRVAIAGNRLDLGRFSPENLPDFRAELDRCLKDPFALEDLAELRRAAEAATTVLYIGDNAGEIVFDRAFIELLSRPSRTIYFAVRGGPVINDVIEEDARQVGMDELATIISTGYRAPGADLSHCSPQFREIFARSDLIIAKGQGNYEALSGLDGPIFLLLQAKCPAIARHIGVEVGAIIAALASRATAASR